MLMEGCKKEVEVTKSMSGPSLMASWKRNDRLGACTVILAVLDDDKLDVSWLGTRVFPCPHCSSIFSLTLNVTYLPLSLRNKIHVPAIPP